MMSDNKTAPHTEPCDCGGTIVFDDENGVAHCNNCGSREAYNYNPKRPQTTVPRPYERVALAIIGPYGNIWTDAVFETPETACAHLDKFWGIGKWKPEEWHVVPATLTVSVMCHGEMVERICLGEFK